MAPIMKYEPNQLAFLNKIYFLLPLPISINYNPCDPRMGAIMNQDKFSFCYHCYHWAFLLEILT